MKNKTTYCSGLAIMALVILVTAVVVVAQNSNSSTTMSPNSNTTAKKPRRHKPKAQPPAAAETTTAEPGQNAATPKKNPGRCDPTQQELTDLSGTYEGRATHGDQTMDATLTITGNNFTMTSGSQSHSGRITAVTTCGYTAVAVSMEGDGSQRSIHSLRARKVGNNLTLTSAPGEPEAMSFTTGGAATGRPRRHKMAKPKTAAPPPTPTPPV